MITLSFVYQVSGGHDKEEQTKPKIAWLQVRYVLAEKAGFDSHCKKDTYKKNTCIQCDFASSRAGTLRTHFENAQWLKLLSEQNKSSFLIHIHI